MNRSVALHLDHVDVILEGASILTDVSLTVQPGEFVALVGPNGAGKSTLLGVAAGDLPATAGQVQLFGAPLDAYTAKEAARERSVLLQEQRIAFGFRVRRVVEMGRTPWYRTPAEHRDDAAVDAAIDQVDIGHLVDRVYPTLSGGEKSRTSLARVIAQESPLVLLDEPTAALDIAHQEQVLAVVRALADSGCAVVVVLHDLALAAQADRVCLLDHGQVVANGRPTDVITSELISEVYGHPVDVLNHRGSLVVVPRRDRDDENPVALAKPIHSVEAG
jgi:iron complex transport system ATP-binding protein